MARFELKFKDFETDYTFIKAEKNNFNLCNVITISGENDGYPFIINLDKSTAIKFAKTLRTEINKIKEPETLKQGDFTTLTRKPKKGGSNG